MPFGLSATVSGYCVLDVFFGAFAGVGVNICFILTHHEDKNVRQSGKYRHFCIQFQFCPHYALR